MNVSNAAPVAPYTNWETAATVIQDAVDVSTNGDTVLVADGIYAMGGRAIYGAMTNRVAITKPITLASLNGPGATWIVGQGVGTGATNNGDGAIRCVYVGTNALLIGFTLTNGHTRISGDTSRNQSGGGVWCDVGGVVSNCTLSGNAACYYGGGSSGGTLHNCTLSGNSAQLYGGGSSYGTLINCTLSGNSAQSGGGTIYGTLNNCTLSSNSTSSSGGGASQSTLNNCTLSGNSSQSGGGAYGGTTKNSTLIGNLASFQGGGSYNATLDNCALSGNSANIGGGVYSGTLTNCILSGNSATNGGGASNGVLKNCTLSDNSAANYAGGSYQGTLNNCTLTGNSARYAGGSYQTTLNNCIVYYNTASVGPNSLYGTLNYCCTTPSPGGTGNITNEPGLVSMGHIAAASPCVGKGSPAYVSGLDIDGQAWRTPPPIGCDEPYAASCTGPVSVAIGAPFTEFAVGYDAPFTALTDGGVTSNAWNFGDGVGAQNQLYASHTWATTGIYAVVLTAWNADHPSGVVCTMMVSVVEPPIYYVNVSNQTPAHPYSSWETAATNIQDAISAAGIPGPRLVMVTNGVYETGGTIVSGGVTNRIALTNSVRVRSVNGPDVTIIQGKGPAGPGAIRCAYVGSNTVLAGFRLTGGATLTNASYDIERYGGGVYCENGALVSNCTVSGNSADYGGGGAYNGTLNNCTLSGNSASDGGGAYNGTLNNCTLSGNSASQGGGAYNGTLNNCTLSGNSGTNGGGVYGGTLNNCTLSGNSARSGGAAWAWNSTLNNCTLSGNSASSEGGGVIFGVLNNCTLSGNSAPSSGGASSSTLNNCIAYYNSAPLSPNFSSGSTLNYCCTTPKPSGTGNITNEPGLVSVGHIAVASSCVGKGSAAYAFGLDIDGQAWRNPPSIGCDEPYAASCTGPVSVAIGTLSATFALGYDASFMALTDGGVTSNAWDFGDGTRARNQMYASHTWAGTGTYAVVLTAWNADHPSGVVSTTVVSVVAQPTYYVNVSNSTPAHPYANWETAATNIQDAISAAGVPGPRLVIVTNGIYETGGALIGAITNRIALTNAVTVRSVNGPNMTIIRGKGPAGPGATRCVYVGTNSVLAGFTLTGGATLTNATYVIERLGGGVYCENGGLVSNCWITGNSASSSGGGAYGGTLKICTLSGNSAGSNGGGSCSNTLNNCTLSGNSAGSNGGGACGGTLNNCIVYYNSATINPNSSAGSLNYCCTTPAASGTGNITNEPSLVSLTHIAVDSACIGKGSAAYAAGLDIDGQPWRSPPSMGCDEPYPNSATGALSVAIGAPFTMVAPEYCASFTALIDGSVTSNAWNFGDGTEVRNQLHTFHSWGTTGTYAVVLMAWNSDHPSGVASTTMVSIAQQVYYANSSNPTPVSPYTSWETAATNIQDAVTAAGFPGRRSVLVTNGTYEAGGAVVSGAITNRIALTNGVTVMSVNGPSVTIIRGKGPAGPGAMRCAFVGTNCVLAGFTLIGGATFTTNGFVEIERNGGGVYCENGGLLSNCWITGNTAWPNNGGGAYGGTLYNCIVTSNSAGGDGGGAHHCALNNCTLTGNSAGNDGGGAHGGILRNCTLSGNSAYRSGGGAYVAALRNCTLSGNSAGSSGGGVYGGGGRQQHPLLQCSPFRSQLFFIWQSELLLHNAGTRRWNRKHHR